MASSAAHQHHHHLHDDADDASGGLVSAPPPTPSNQSLVGSLNCNTDAALSRFLHQLLLSPKTLSPLSPTLRRRSSLSSSSSSSSSFPPLLSLLRLRQDQFPLRSAASDFGFFYLVDHGVASGIPAAALVEAQSLVAHHHPASAENLTSLGFCNHESDDDDEHFNFVEKDRILALEGDGNKVGEELGSFPALKGYVESLEKASMELIEMLSSVERGFQENPFRRDGYYKQRHLLWITESRRTREIGGGISNCNGVEKEEDQMTEMRKSKCYPYVLGFHLMQEVKQQPWRVLGDSAEWINVDSPGSNCGSGNRLLVTFGDITQVWSNGRFKKVNGRPRPSFFSPDSCVDDGSSLISVSFFLTLPLDSVISPFLPPVADHSHHLNSQIVDEVQGGDKEDEGEGKFRAFGLEEYAWRLYHERLPIKDPLLKYCS